MLQVMKICIPPHTYILNCEIFITCFTYWMFRYVNGAEIENGSLGQSHEDMESRYDQAFSDLRLLHTMNVRFSLLDIAQRILGVTLPNFQ
jgi:hypothetical protein